jgi:hypothetical protein
MSRHFTRSTAALALFMTIATSLGLMASFTSTPAQAVASPTLSEQTQAQAEFGSDQLGLAGFGRPGHQVD